MRAPPKRGPSMPTPLDEEDDLEDEIFEEVKVPQDKAASLPVGNVLWTWSEWQNAIFREVVHGSGHVVVQAYAGASKTSSAMEAIRRIPPGKRILMVAFNKSIAEELKNQAPAYVEVRTLHSHGLKTVRNYWNLKKIDDKRQFEEDNKARDHQMMVASGLPMGTPLAEEIYLKLRDLIFKCKSFMATDEEKVREVQRDYELLLGNNGYYDTWEFSYTDHKAKKDYYFNHENIFQWVYNALRFSVTPPKDGRISFSDMIFAPAILPKLVPRQYDYVFVDETQDMTAAQLELAIKSVNPKGGRIIAIGDENQSIYSFTGADSRAIPRIRERLNAKTLMLPESFRVPFCAAHEVQKIIPDFKVPNGTPRGTCESVNSKFMVANWDNDDFVITRINAPVTSLVMLAIATGKNPLAIGGEDVPVMIRNIFNAAFRANPKMKSPKGLMKTVRSIVNKEIKKEVDEELRKQKLKTYNQYTAQQIEEMPNIVLMNNTLHAIEMLAKRFDTIEEIFAFVDAIVMPAKQIEEMSHEQKRKLNKGRLIFSTVHRIKGAEANRTWVLEETFKYNRNGFTSLASRLSEREATEEKNLFYVAITRVKNEKNKPGQLYYVQNLKDILGGYPEIPKKQ